MILRPVPVNAPVVCWPLLNIKGEDEDFREEFFFPVINDF